MLCLQAELLQQPEPLATVAAVLGLIANDLLTSASMPPGERDEVEKVLAHKASLVRENAHA